MRASPEDAAGLERDDVVALSFPCRLEAYRGRSEEALGRDEREELARGGEQLAARETRFPADCKPPLNQRR